MPRKDKAQLREYQNQWQRDNRGKCQESQNRYLEKNPDKKLLKASKNNAKARGLEHTITLDDIVIPTHCPYLGIELTTKPEKVNTHTTVSLDRIDPTKGYVSGNVQVISRLANLMKSNASLEQLLTFANGVLKLHAQ